MEEMAGMLVGQQTTTPWARQALVVIKPLGMVPSIRQTIKSRLSEYGSICHCSRRSVSKDLARAHYRGSEFKSNGERSVHFPAITTYLTGQKVEAFVLNAFEDYLYGTDEQGFHDFMRKEVVGPSDPEKTGPAHLRHMAKKLSYKRPVNVAPEAKFPGYQPFAKDNLVHFSDSPESARREIGLWFEYVPGTRLTAKAEIALNTAPENRSVCAA